MFNTEYQHDYESPIARLFNNRRTLEEALFSRGLRDAKGDTQYEPLSPQHPTFSQHERQQYIAGKIAGGYFD